MAYLSHNLTLFESVRDGAIAIVPYACTASNLKKQYASWLLKQQQLSWNTPSILSWDVWLNACWRDFTRQKSDTRIVLTLLQQRLAWNQLIEAEIQSNPGSMLWNRDASISQAINAWQRVYEFQIEPANWHDYDSNEAVFARWFKKYEANLRESNWVDPVMIPGILIDQCYFPPEKRILVWNQSSLTPLKKQWLAHIQTHSIVTNFPAYPPPDSAGKNPVLQAYPNFESQLGASALWARDYWIEHPESKIVIAIAEIKNRAKKVEQVFGSVFTHDHWLDKDQAMLYEVCGTRMLADSPLVGCALDCLELLRKEFDYQDFSKVLHNPFIRNATMNRQLYSLWDAWLRQYCLPVETLSHLIGILNHPHPDDPGKRPDSLIQELEQVMTLAQSMHVMATPATWCELFSKTLSLLGWPDFDNLNTDEQLQVKYWDQALILVCQGSLVCQKLNLSRMLTLLQDITQSTPMHKKSVAPIKIIDITQLEGARFDAGWVCDLNDSIVPPGIRLSPLIPIGLQRNHSMPLSNIDSCKQHADQQLLAICNLAEELRFSYYTDDETGQCRPAPVFSNIETMHFTQIQDIAGKTVSSGDLDSYTDDHGSCYELSGIRGGSYTLKRQAQCPFQAYAVNRLEANRLEYPEPGIGGDVKGRLVHTILQHIWKQIGNQSVLKQLADRECEQLVERHVSRALTRIAKDQPLFVEIESRRLTNLILEWLKIEQLRPGFVVQEQERKTSLKIRGIDIDLKIDRIDELEDGRHLIIDYKTGFSDSRQWLGNKLEDPQLPMYALAMGAPVRAIGFANLRGCLFDGVSEDDTGITGIKHWPSRGNSKLGNYLDWTDLVRHWQVGVEELVEDFIQGQAQVNPVSENICKSCGRQSLCRIYQYRQVTLGDDVLADE